MFGPHPSVHELLPFGGPGVRALGVRDIAGRSDRLVRHRLFGSDRTRWLSLASQLPALAEASPHEVLSAVEDGIAAPDGAARAVFHETSGTGFGSRCGQGRKVVV